MPGRRPAAWAPTPGIQDAHNLAWKLAAVVKGTAGAGLLDTYDQERRPTGLHTMGHAMARFGTRVAAGQGPEVLDDGAVAMGYQYRSRPLRAAPPTVTRGRGRRWR